MARVKLDRVTKVFPGDVVAVKDVSLDVQDKEFVVLVGPSGCGKSTTLRMVAGLEEIDEGTISIGDRVVNDVPPKDRDIAMVFQNYALYPHMTVYKNMAFGLRLRRFPKAEIDTRVKQAAGILGISELLDRKPKALSGGQRQRVAVGRAIVRQPKVFLFDEPLSNLDAKLRVEMRAELKKLHRRLEATMIYVTHDQVEAMTLGDRIVILNEGVVQQIDTPLSVYNNPANKFVAGFIGTPPMNFFKGTLESSNGSVTFVGDCGSVDLPEEKASRLAGKAGGPVVLGLRPEDAAVGPASGETARDRISAEITVIEPLGDDMLVYLSAGEEDFVLKLEPSTDLEVGAPVSVSIDTSKVHVFDDETGVNLTGAQG
jgi:multiple sugar transport system ATP-binding protein